MSDWTSGYVTEIDYTHGYYGELNPMRAKLAFIHAGLAFPNIQNACELAFGQGVSINIHAAAQAGRWFGNDFNPAQATFAQELSQAAGSNALLTDESFEDFCKREDLPEFDFIALHGIFSWVTPDNQKYIEDFIRRKLRMGGVLYISYNTFPGWSGMMPIQHLMSQHSQVMGAEGVGVLQRLDAAVQFVDKVLEAKPATSRVNPHMVERFRKLKDQNRHYLAHEYFNRNWEPMFFGEMAARMRAAKLSYACSATLTDHVDALNFSAEQQAVLRSVTDPVFRETVRDFIVNQQFRRDYWVKGARRLTGLEQMEALKGLRFMLTGPRPPSPLKVQGAAGEATLQEAVYNPILDMLQDHKPHTLDSLLQGLAKTHPDFKLAQLLQAIMVLAAMNKLQPIQDTQAIAQAKNKTARLNSYLLQRARSRSEINALASPVTGGGVAVPYFEQQFLLALQQGRKTPEELAAGVWGVLQAQNQKMLKEGKPLEGAEAHLAELTPQARSFMEKQLPLLRALQVI